MELNVQDWKEFRIDRLFTVVLSKGDVKADDMDYGTIRLVSSGENNNGIVAHIDSKGDGKAEIFDGNVITADMFCNAYYQNECFYAVSHGRVNILLPNFELNSYVGLFISTIINNEKYKYSYGRALYSNVVSSMVVKLPTQFDKDNNTYVIDENRTYSDEGYVPDWQFMEDYIKSLHHKPITTQVTSGNTKELEIDKWEEFKVSDLFSRIYKAKAYTKEDVIETNKGIHFVSRTDCNNGVDTTVDKDTRYEGLEESNCLTIGDTTATCFYQNEKFIAGDHMVVLRADWLNLKRGLFFRTLFAQEGIRYCYGRAYRMDLIKATLLKLPIQRDNNGNPIIDDNHTYSEKGYIPDWQFMEDYINSLPYSDRI